MEKQENRPATESATSKTKVLSPYRKPEIKKQGNLKKITALSFQPPD
jgi:hypothetical protein